jgi:hypothetical protein
MSTEEALTMVKAAMYQLTRQPFEKLIVISYSISSIAMVNLWPKLKAVTAHHHSSIAWKDRWRDLLSRQHPVDCCQQQQTGVQEADSCGCHKLCGIFVGCGLTLPEEKYQQIFQYFTPQVLELAGRYPKLLAAHGEFFHWVLACVRRWCSGLSTQPLPAALEGDLYPVYSQEDEGKRTNPAAQLAEFYGGGGESFFLTSNEQRRMLWGDSHAHFICGTKDFVYEVSDIWTLPCPRPPKPELVLLPTETENSPKDSPSGLGMAVHGVNDTYAYLWCTDGSKNPLPSSAFMDMDSLAHLYIVPGDHFELFTLHQEEVGKSIVCAIKSEFKRPSASSLPTAKL